MRYAIPTLLSLPGHEGSHAHSRAERVGRPPETMLWSVLLSVRPGEDADAETRRSAHRAGTPWHKHVPARIEPLAQAVA
jgi:hypothetical protein